MFHRSVASVSLSGAPISDRTHREPSILQRRAALHLDGMKVGEVLRLLLDDGWFLACTRGSHRQVKHAQKRGRVTVPDKESDDLAPGTLNSILEQAGLKR